jgi:endonuclease G, mitochondrial
MSLISTLTLLFVVALDLAAQHDRFGTPACSGSGQEFADRSFFVICHSSDRRVPLWVGYELTPDQLERTATRPAHFRHDPDLSGPSAYDSDYRNSGYSRGHMAPAADFAFSQASIRATFLLSNAVPQHQAVNQGRWAQVETAVRRIAAASDVTYVFTGPIFESAETERIGDGHVSVPTHTFKVILVLHGTSKTMYAAIVPNAVAVREPLNQFAVTVEEVERRTGFDFFSALEDSEERDLEGTLQLFPVRSSH